MQKYLSLTGHVYTPAYLTAGSKKWATLPADVRKVLEDTAKDMQKYVYAIAEKDENELLDKIKAAGVQVNEADKAAFVAASKNGLRGIRQGSEGLEGTDRQGPRPRQSRK